MTRARRVEARKNLLQPKTSVKTVPTVASLMPAVSLSPSLLGLPSAAALQVPSKLSEENIKALAEMKDTLQALSEDFHQLKTAAPNAAQTNHNQNFQP